jgi:isocitrate lyase
VSDLGFSRVIFATLGASTGNQAVQQVKAGLKAIYLSGWQVAADAKHGGTNVSGPSLYPVDSVPNVVKRINNALRRADQIAHAEGDDGTYWMAPIVADAEAGFGGALNAYELMKAMIEAGAARVHFEDQLASEKKYGHLGGKVLVPVSQHIRTLNAARLAADVEGVPTVCRTDAYSAQLLTSDIDERDRPFITGERTPEGFFRVAPGMGLDYAIARGLALRALCRPLVVGDERARFGRGRAFRRGDTPRIPRQALGLQLLAELQLAQGAGARQDRRLSARHRADGLPLPVRDTGRLSPPQSDDVQPGSRLPRARHGRLLAEFAAEAEGYTAKRHQRGRLFRCGGDSRQHRGGAVL